MSSDVRTFYRGRIVAADTEWLALHIPTWHPHRLTLLNLTVARWLAKWPGEARWGVLQRVDGVWEIRTMEDLRLTIRQLHAGDEIDVMRPDEEERQMRPGTEHPCHGCQGQGWVETSKGDVKRCPVCEGTGRAKVGLGPVERSGGGAQPGDDFHKAR